MGRDSLSNIARSVTSPVRRNREQRKKTMRNTSIVMSEVFKRTNAGQEQVSQSNTTSVYCDRQMRHLYEASRQLCRAYLARGMTPALVQLRPSSEALPTLSTYF